MSEEELTEKEKAVKDTFEIYGLPKGAKVKVTVGKKTVLTIGK